VTKFRLLDDAKTNLVGTVSHELKTPLTGLRMAVYLLLEKTLGPLAPAQREMLESARTTPTACSGYWTRSSTSRASRRAPPRSSAGRSRSDALLRDRRRGPRVHLGRGPEARAPRAEPGLGECQRRRRPPAARVHQPPLERLEVFPDGGTITLGAAPAPLGFVRFSVRDQGAGIPAEALPACFDRFYRVPGQSKPGAGIGLAIAREIVVAHGGSISCASSAGEGTEFHFLIPAG
jgi:two-component system, NtrC family, sensor histidine kinase KinB